MLIATEAIVLSKLKYKDRDLIVKCYTKEKGTVSYLLKNILSKKSRISSAYFQQLSLLELQTNFKENRSLHYISDVKILIPYQTLHTNLVKSTVVMFLSEILSSLLQEEEPHKNLFTFIKTAFLVLDKETTFSNFHIMFLLQLTKYLGFYPDTENSHYSYFNLLEGKFQDSDTNEYCIKNESLTLFKKILGIKFDAYNKLNLSNNQRQSLLNMILLYFQLHLDGFKKPKSLGVLNQVFN